MAAARECTYCGAAEALTNDHVPPKNLFPSPRPSNLITVPACARCNAGASKDDEYFRSILLSIDELANHPQVVRLIPKEHYALSRPEKKATALAFERSIHKVEVVSAQGISLSKCEMRESETPRLCRVASRIVRGLYYHRFGHRLPDDYLATACQEPHYLPADAAKQREEFDKRFAWEIPTLRKEPASTIGDEVFLYSVVVVDAATFQTKWLLEFYGFLRFLVFTDHVSNTKASTHRHTFPASLIESETRVA